MLVVADSSALVALSVCEALDLLLKVYDDVRVPRAVYDASGCSATAMLNISEPMPLSYSNVNFSNPTCVGVTDGIITVTAIGGTPPTYYSILPVVGIQNQPGIFSNLLSSQYTIVATETWIV